MVLIATSRCSRSSSATKTTPIPPSPSFRTMRYGPMRSVMRCMVACSASGERDVPLSCAKTQDLGCTRAACGLLQRTCETASWIHRRSCVFAQDRGTGPPLAARQMDYHHPVSMVRNALMCVVLAAAWAAQAAVLPPGTYSFRTYGSESGLGSLAAMRLAQDSDGYLWVGTQDGIYRYDGTRFEHFGLDQGLPSTFVSSLRAARDGSVWACTVAGVAHFDGKRFVVPPALPPRVAPNAIAIDDADANHVYVALPQGLVLSSGAPVSGWPAATEATAVWCDRTGELWAATHGGVARLARGVWTWWNVSPRERIDNVVVDAERRVWARSANHLWSKGEHDETFTDESRALPATSNNGYLALDAHRNLWVPTDAGVAVHDANGWRRIGPREGLPTEWARDVLEDREGSVWIASLGVHRMLGRGELVSYKRGNGLPNEVTWCFRWDRDGHLLVGTDAGLARSTAGGWCVVHCCERLYFRSTSS